MAIYRVVGEHVLSETEYAARSRDISAVLERNLESTEGMESVSLSGGRTLDRVSLVAESGGSGFTPIGVGCPLTIRIRHVYTGRYPNRSWTGHRGDMALVSGVKNLADFEASSRALNFLQPEVGPHSNFVAPDVFTQGTPVVLYVPAVTQRSITIGIEMATANDFVKGLLTAISGAFTASAGIPLFLPADGYLLGAGAILKLGEGVADALYESQPAFQSTGTIEFSDEGEDSTVAGWRILCNSGLAATDYAFKAGTGLVDRGGRTYDGDEPYIVLSLDGRQDKDLEGFTPHAATAGVLQKFFGMKDGAQTVADTLVQAMTLYSDLQYRQKADRLKGELNATSDGPAKAELQKLYDATVKNIQQDVLKPH